MTVPKQSQESSLARWQQSPEFRSEDILGGPIADYIAFTTQVDSLFKQARRESGGVT